MRNIIAMIIVVVSTIICFAGCSCDNKTTQSKVEQVVKEVPKQEQTEQKVQPKPEAKPVFVKESDEVKPEMWTVGIGDIKRVGDDLVSSITIGPLGPNETSDFMFVAGTEIFPDFMVMEGQKQKGSNGYAVGVFSEEGTHKIQVSRFFKDYSPVNKNDHIVKVWVEISMNNGEVRWEGNEKNPQRFSIK